MNAKIRFVNIQYVILPMLTYLKQEHHGALCSNTAGFSHAGNGKIQVKKFATFLMSLVDEHHITDTIVHNTFGTVPTLAHNHRHRRV
jgi:hypothetical protein